MIPVIRARLCVFGVRVFGKLVEHEYACVSFRVFSIGTVAHIFLIDLVIKREWNCERGGWMTFPDEIEQAAFAGRYTKSLSKNRVLIINCKSASWY